MRRAALAVVVLTLNVGCAAIFTGTRQEISVISTPPGSTVVVLGGTAANVALRARQVSDLREPALALLGPALPEEARAVVQAWSIDELVTKLVLLTRLSELPPELVASAGEFLRLVPRPIVERLSEMLGIEGAGVTPTQYELKKGRAYALVTWQKGYGAKLLKVDTTFNWVVLLNIFNGIIPGLLVDGLTGAWLNLTPKEVVYTLEPLPAATP
ncbi:MAG: hypothetical protein AB1730_28180 [Myxococcota bacterium]|jgi:hypothetical protein